MQDTVNAKRLTKLPLENSLQAALEIANMGAWCWDETAGEYIWSIQTESILGLPPQAEMTRELFVSLLHPEDVPRYREAWAAANDPKGAGIYESTYRIRRASDGAERWIHSKARVEFVGEIPVRALGALRDITEDRAATARLRESEQQLSLFIEHAPAGIAMFDRNMRYLAASARWNSDYGLKQTPVGRSQYEVFPKISEAWKAVHRRCLAGAIESSDGELFARADGSAQWVKWEARPWKDGRGEIGGIIISTEDITARKEAEARSAYLAAIVASSADAIISKSLDGEIMSWNAGATHLFGYAAEEMLGQPIARIIPPEWIEDENRILARLRSGELINEYETQRLAKDGRRIDVCLTISQVRDAVGKIIGASKIVRDITDRKRIELALRKSEERLQLALGAGRMGIWEWELATDVCIWSDETYRLLGYQLGSVAPSYKAWAQRVLPEDLAQTEAGLREMVEHGALYAAEYRVLGEKDEVRWLEWRGQRLVDKDGRASRAIGVIVDITVRKAAEEAVALAKAEAERANFAKSKFLAAASHDLRQPVQSLTLLLNVIERQVADRPKAANLVSMANASMVSLNGMLTGILDISRLDAGVITPVIASADLGELVDRMAREYAPRASAVGLVLRHAPRALRARTDVALLERILRNLIENALRYTAKGRVLISVRPRGESVRIDVIDTGIGIPASQQKEIFEEFRQLKNPARDSSQGLGLGLAIVSRLARIINTEIQVASRLDHGTRFSLLLPLDKSAPPPVRATPGVEDAGGRILIIEDNPGVRQAYEIMLNEWGYDTLSAASGEEALDRAAQELWGFDAIIADHRLGSGLTGNAAAAEIARRAGRFVPTVLITGDTGGKRLSEVSSCGFALLHKPVDADDLRRTVASLLRGGE